MTSTSIYTPITPTYLYIKQHSVTKKKYFGKTTNLDPYTYNGSGKHWSRHIKKHGKEHIVTLWVSDLYYDTSIIDVALKFSSDNDIVKSKEWANLEPENGLNGGTSGAKRSEETKAKMRKPKSEEHKANMHKPKSEEAKANMKGRVPPNKGKPQSEEQNAAKSVRQIDKKHKPHKPRSDKGKPRSEETKAKMRKPKQKQKQITCPHCGKTGGGSNMKRWHFDNCTNQSVRQIDKKHKTT